MAPVTQLGLVVLATSSVAFAARGGHGKGHTHKPRVSKYPSTGAPSGAPFGYGNGTATAGPTASGISNTTSTTTNVETQTVYNTVTIPGQSGAGATSVPVGGASVGSTCGGTVSVTVTDTVTVTAGSETGAGAPSSSAAAPSSSAAAASSYAPAPVGPSPIDSSASEYAPTETTFTARSVAPTAKPSAAKVGSTAQKSKAAAAPAPAKSSYAAAPAPASSSAAAPASSPSSSSSSSSSSGGKIGTKRGCLYKGSDSSGCDGMVSSGKVKWSTNWSPDSSSAPKGAQYIPQMWGLRSEDTSSFSSAAGTAIKNGASAVIGWNEPDRSDQAGITANSDAVAKWNQYVTPLKSDSVTIVSPGPTSQITNGEIQGMTWLKAFKQAGASWDATGIHFYANCADSDLSVASGQTKYLKQYVDEASKEFGKPVWVTEFGCYDGTPTEQVEAFMKVAVPYLEGEGNVAHYAPYMASVLASGSSLNAAGQAYVSAGGN